MDKVVITQKRVQLIETVQSFMIDGKRVPIWERFVYSGTLPLNGEKTTVIEI